MRGARARLFFANQGADDPAVIAAADGALIMKVGCMRGRAQRCLCSPQRSGHVATLQAGTVTGVDGVNYAVLDDLQLGAFYQTIAVDPTTNAVYVTNSTRGLPRNAPAGAPVLVDPVGDIVTLIRP
ncbi:hypothetical protein [Brevundimonas vesicularis]|uniref:Uncharacterized protein n=1 Tax=Brevundimonas vesicularis TaxID=41276 RepID=A0A1Z3U4Y1_BREVE|nr:hypothetical protein [Brevundimonas vesicularis]ASE38336.1 hypothetical protein CEP68_01775 [Brevundimonas vesicularis]MDX2333574.1 hypothetical protein [Brevundimonas vesicularis]